MVVVVVMQDETLIRRLQRFLPPNVAPNSGHRTRLICHVKLTLAFS